MSWVRGWELWVVIAEEHYESLLSFSNTCSEAHTKIISFGKLQTDGDQNVTSEVASGNEYKQLISERGYTPGLFCKVCKVINVALSVIQTQAVYLPCPEGCSIFLFCMHSGENYDSLVVSTIVCKLMTFDPFFQD